MTARKTVLLVGGTGNLGRKVAAALASKEGVELRILVRNRRGKDQQKQQQLQQLEALGAALVEGDLNDKTNLEQACAGVDTVVSTLNGWEDVVVTGQLNLLDAAKQAGVLHFMPSDFSVDYSKLQLGEHYLLDHRIKVAQAVKASGLNYTVVMNGAFMEIFFSPFFQVFDLERGTVEYWGDGDTKLDLTTVDDTAKYTAEAVIDPRAVNTTFQVAGDVITLKEAIAAYEEITGRSLILHRKGSLADLQAWIEQTKATNPDPWAVIPAMYQLPMEQGRVKLQHLVNERYPHIKPTSVRKYLASPSFGRDSAVSAMTKV